MMKRWAIFVSTFHFVAHLRADMAVSVRCLCSLFQEYFPTRYVAHFCRSAFCTFALSQYDKMHLCTILKIETLPGNSHLFPLACWLSSKSVSVEYVSFASCATSSLQMFALVWIFFCLWLQNFQHSEKRNVNEIWDKKTHGWWSKPSIYYWYRIYSFQCLHELQNVLICALWTDRMALTAIIMIKFVAIIFSNTIWKSEE